MAYTNSPLVSYKRITKHKSIKRDYAITRITPHIIVGQWTAKQGVDYFATTSRKVSSNYVVGKDGKIGLSVEEKDRAWTSSSPDNDNRAITIECASDKTHPYALTQTTYDTLIKLCIDICKRNGKKKLLWLGSKSKTLSYKPAKDELVLTAHRWFANTSCPGDWLYSRLENLASEVSKQLGSPSGMTDVSIMGESVLSAEELGAWFTEFEVTPKISLDLQDFIQVYLDEGEVEGVRGDIAFIQSVHETGKFLFTGDVVPEQMNYAGIGTVGGGVKGHYFKTVQEGIRAQIQHLKAYASKEPLKNKSVDPRFHLVSRGSAKTVRGLTGKWATDKAYGDKLMNYYNAAIKYKQEKGEDDLKYNISILDKRDGAAALEVLFAGEEGSVISKGGNFKYGKEKDIEIVGIGKDRSSHTSYLGYFISGATAAETLEKAKDFVSGNKEKYKAPEKGR